MGRAAIAMLAPLVPPPSSSHFLTTVPLSLALAPLAFESSLVVAAVVAGAVTICFAAAGPIAAINATVVIMVVAVVTAVAVVTGRTLHVQLRTQGRG